MSELLTLNNASALLMLLATFFIAYCVCRAHLRVSQVIATWTGLVYAVVCMPILLSLKEVTGITDNRAVLPFYAVFFGLFFFSVDLSFSRALVLYLWAVVLIAFPANIASLTDAALHPDHTQMQFEPDALFIQLGLTAALMLYVWHISHRWDGRILSEDYTSEALWIGWLSVPILFLGLYISLLPEDYRMLHAYSLYGTYLFFTASLVVLYLYLTSIFYAHMYEYVQLQEYKEAQRIADIQRLQFDNLQQSIEADRRARHDFKHTLHLLSQLAAGGDLEGLRRYIREYTKDSTDTLVKNYCANAPINAVLNYYEKQAVSRGITTTLQVDLNADIPLSDPEFASLLGNIMENAIDACGSTIAGEKKFSLSIRVQNDSMLYIVSSNTYDGDLFAEADDSTTFSSKKLKHHGIGLKSIRQTVDKYNGTLRITNTDTEFFLDIAIQI